MEGGKVATSGRRGRHAAAEKRANVAAIVQGLRRIVRALHSYSQGVRARYGLTGPQLWALKTLQRSGPLATGGLAEALAVHQSSVSLLLDRLEERGLITRRRRVDDQRVVEVHLTRRGAALAADAPEAAQGRLLHALDAMSAAEVHHLSRAVRRLVTAMEAVDVHAEFFFAE
jgi:MarR family transcriptional regulator, organic hydroperoxide resistance regulator